MSQNNKEFDTPILFLVFNRPDTTKRAFEAIKKIRPKKLFIAADGPRQDRLEDIECCAEVRNIVNNIDWPCDVKKLFQDKNLGCRIAPPTAIDWFFNNIEEGIILEDDCVPDASFFYFCQELLSRYRDDEQVAIISGSSLIPFKTNNNDSYRFSIYPLLWGWATWRRVWLKHDINMSSYPDFIKKNRIQSITKVKIIQKYWLTLFDKSYQKLLNTWDYPLLYSVWNSNRLSIIPSENMITNIGFSSDATHTKNPNHPFNNLIAKETTFPLIHPTSKIPNKKTDNRLFYYALAIGTSPFARFKKYVRKILFSA